MQLRNYRYRCDLCNRVGAEADMIHLPEDDPYQHLCRECVTEGWLSYCNTCGHTFPPDQLDQDYNCPACKGQGGVIEVW